MHRARRTAVLLAGLGLLGLPAPAATAAETLPVAVFAEDPSRGARTYDAARGADVTATLTSPQHAFRVEAWDGTVRHVLTVTTTVPLGPGTFRTGSGVEVAVSSCPLSGTMTVTELTTDPAGALATLAATYDGTCGWGRFVGAVRYHSAEPWRGVHAPAMAFPGTLVRASSSQAVTITATGTTPVPLGTAAVTEPFAVTADGCSGVTLEPGGSCALTVSFTPQSAGGRHGELTLPSDGPRGVVLVPLSGTGVSPPPAPVGLRAVAGHDGVGLSWTAPVGDATGYRIYRDGGAEPVATVTATHYADPAAPGQTHSYGVSTVVAAGEGVQRAEASATVPTEVTATTGDATGFAVDTPTEDFATTAVTLPDPVAGTVRLRSGGRWVTLRPRSGSAWAPGTVTATVEAPGCWPAEAELTVPEAKVGADGTPVTLAVSGTYPCGEGTAYLDLRYAARAPLVAGDVTPEVVRAPVTKPGASTPVTTVTVANGGSAALDLGTATAPGAWPVTGDTCSGTSLAPGTSCTLGVAFAPAHAAVHHGTLTIPDNTPRGHRTVRLEGVSTDVPGPVRDLVATPLAGRVLLTYGAPENAYPPVTSYVVSRGLSPDGPFTEVGTTQALRYGDPFAVAGKRRYYRVRARNAQGDGAPAVAGVVTVATELVYAADAAGGPYQLTARGLPGGRAVRLTTSAKPEADPSFSPRGTLAFTREDVPGRYHVYLSRPDGTYARRAAGDVDGVPWTYRNPRLSPDHSRLAYACRPTAQPWWELCVRSQTSGAVRKIPSVLAGGGSWLPNGNELLVVSATSPPTVQVVAFDNSYRVAIPGTAGARQVALSPDASRFAWVRYDGDGVPDLGGVPPYSLRVSPLSGGAGIALTAAGASNDPSWSPDGGTVYFTHVTGAADGRAARDVYSAPATGGPLTRLTDTPEVDEEHVAFRDPLALAPSPLAPRQMADFTGDGRAEIAVFRPGTGAWRIRGLPTVVWGRLGDIPVAADYHGDRRAERAVYRPATGTWHIHGRSAVKHGRPGDVPVPADYDGDGKAELAVFRPATGSWHVSGRAPVVFGAYGVVPAPADYDGDRKADIAFYVPEHGTWFVHGRRYDGTASVAGVPVPADYLGLGRAQFAVLSGRTWHVSDVFGSIATVPRTYHDVPAYGNFGGDRRAEPGVFNPTLGLWRILGRAGVVWGVPGDIPV